MKTSYLFYDIETTGLNKCFDQVLQFAAIRTDMNLKEIDRCEIRIALNPDVIPSPEAIMTHRIPIAETQRGLLEVEGIRQIHQLLNTPGTISVGYNTLEFDDEFLRFGFYRNLLPPYTHQYANQCARMDIYPIAVMFYLFKRDALQWPILDNKISFKLEKINALNQLTYGQAHNALVDVEATLLLARKFAEHKEMWDFLCGYFQKNVDAERLTALPSSFTVAEHTFQEGLLVSGKLGNAAQFQTQVLGLGEHYHYRNQTRWLRLDDVNFTKVTESSISEHTHVLRKRMGESPIMLQPKQRFLKMLPVERRRLTDENRLWLQKHPDLFQKIRHHHLNDTYPVFQDVDCEALLYNAGFPPALEEKQYQQFHQASVGEKEKIAENFADPIRRELAMRLLARHFPTALSTKNQSFYHDYLKRVISGDEPPIDYRGECHLTPQYALKKIETLKTQMLDSEQKQLLGDLENYLKKQPISS